MSELVTGWYGTFSHFVDTNQRFRFWRNLIVFVVLVRYGGCFFWALYDRGVQRILRDFRQALLARVFKAARYIPGVQAKIDKEIGGQLKEMRSHVTPDLADESLPSYPVLPSTGLSEEAVYEALERLRGLKTNDYKDGQVSGAIYHAGTEISRIAVRAYETFLWSNPLHADLFPAVRRMEAEVVAMVIKMFNGGSDACGTTTSGGTESILMAVKTYRDWAKDVKGITSPELVVPVTAHCAFDKACSYFNIKIVHVPVDPKSMRVDVRAMRRAVTSNTIAVVASAPQFPHGVIDDVQAVAVIARANKIGLHVDCCLGGFLLPFMQKAGFPLAPFDFRVPGVTSISCDTHKYGFTPKGSSVILYSNKKLRSYQYFVVTNWPGGIYASPTIAGSRSGAVLAACWATMVHMGEEGYIACTREIVSAARKISSAVNGIDGLKLMGNPEVSVVSVGSDKFDIYRLSAALAKRGWNLNSLQFPPCIHLCVTYANKDRADDFIRDLREETAEIMKTPSKPAEGSAAIYGLAQALPDRSLVDQIARGYVDLLYEH
jgi:sphinganine-1-phosphate aldolase